jgi:dCTP deaminase
MFLNDKQISKLQELDLIMPFVGEKRRTTDDGQPAISYGLSQCGYDARLSASSFVSNGKELSLCATPNGEAFALPPLTGGHGVILERLTMPSHIGGLIFGKSTYTRQGLITNATPIEPGWAGHLTIHFFNGSDRTIFLYPEQGIIQLCFFDCGEVAVPYTGHYQNQGETVTMAKVG